MPELLSKVAEWFSIYWFTYGKFPYLNYAFICAILFVSFIIMHSFYNKLQIEKDIEVLLFTFTYFIVLSFLLSFVIETGKLLTNIIVNLNFTKLLN